MQRDEGRAGAGEGDEDIISKHKTNIGSQGQEGKQVVESHRFGGNSGSAISHVYVSLYVILYVYINVRLDVQYVCVISHNHLHLH